jgi:hypothetical protein
MRLAQRELGALALGDVHHDRADRGGVAVGQRVVVAEERPPARRHQLDLELRLAGLDHPAQDRLELVGERAEHVAHRAAQALLDGVAVHGGERLRDRDVAQPLVVQRVPDRRPRRRGVEEGDHRAGDPVHMGLLADRAVGVEQGRRSRPGGGGTG